MEREHAQTKSAPKPLQNTLHGKPALGGIPTQAERLNQSVPTSSTPGIFRPYTESVGALMRRPWPILAEWLSEEREVKLIVMWQAQSELYEVINNEYSIEMKYCWSCSSILWFCPRSAILRFRLSLSALTTRHIFCITFYLFITRAWH